MSDVSALNAIDLLSRGLPPSLHGARLGVVANPASVNAHFRHTLDIVSALAGKRLVCAFGPQHGARGDMQDNMIESPDAIDERLGIPVYSLYGEHRKPAPQQLDGLDALVCDLPDVGARPYTFLSTMLLALEACAGAGKRFVVLDRVNPINGMTIEGHVLDRRFSSFIGLAELPMRHGLTLGELARLANSKLGAELEVIPVQGWRRDQWQDETGTAWVLPSPNMPTLDTATVYPGTVLVEGTNLSEGRGTTRPFEIVGAPFLDADQLAARLNGLELGGVRFRPCWFRPTFDKHAGQLCGGVQVHVTDRNIFYPYCCGLHLLKAARESAPADFAWREPPFEYVWDRMPIDILAGTDRVRRGLEGGVRVDDLETAWLPEQQAFEETRASCLLYTGPRS
jgi:uncharacterized protein YbbC (DUF1343 family)